MLMCYVENGIMVGKVPISTK